MFKIPVNQGIHVFKCYCNSFLYKKIPNKKSMNTNKETRIIKSVVVFASEHITNNV
jgi:hypothetical protein